MSEREIKQWKKDAVAEFAKKMDEAKIIGIVNMMNLPAKQLQNMRERLRQDVDLEMTRKTLLKLALKKSKREGIDKLEPYLKGMPALLFSEENPFRLYSIIKKNKSKAPIKGGQEAPYDIVVPAGPTPFPPGPVIGELGSFGIPAGVEGDKVAVKKDTVVAKAGDVVDAKLAALLTRLGIEPMEIGLDLVAVLEEGEILTRDVLDIDEEAYKQNFNTAASWAFNLAFNAGYYTVENLPLMISKNHLDALALANAQDILNDETVKPLLAKANMQMLALKASVPDAPAVAAEPAKEEASSEEKPAAEEKPVEEPKEEAAALAVTAEKPAETVAETPAETTSEPVAEPVAVVEEKAEELAKEAAEDLEKDIEEEKAEETKESPAEEPKEDPVEEPKEEAVADDAQPAEETPAEKEEVSEEPKGKAEKSN